MIGLTRRRLRLQPFFSINLLPNTLADFKNCQNFHFLTKLKITAAIAQRFLSQKIKKEIYGMNKFFICPSWSSWYLTFLPKTLFKVRKFAYNRERFVKTNKIQAFFAIAITPLKQGTPVHQDDWLDETQILVSHIFLDPVIYCPESWHKLSWIFNIVIL